MSVTLNLLRGMQNAQGRGDVRSKSVPIKQVSSGLAYFLKVFIDHANQGFHPKRPLT
ncbi:MAG: hypothetical protein RMX68_023940 [Aulosira sp. ZfuVER01]|nr:hypothetical protein [Aulosira sp. ZfuVER01]MDZ7998461.1 hypothetical protein [Aulosira sp. DedVER01a]MDZ8050239.1 hypothetical protein [Aulosira sp. ZfuCHP01]